VDTLLQVRMGSRRLPGKALLPALGRPLLWYNLERIRAAKHVSRVILLTSTDPADDILAELARQWGVEIHRGALDDVLDRTYGCARAFGLAVFAKCTADNPLIDPAVVDAVIAGFGSRASELDYFSNNHPPTWQDGQEVEVIRTAALEQAWREARAPHQREHVTPFLWEQPERFRCGNLARETDDWYREYRWTLDFPEDYEVIRTVIEELHPARQQFSTADIMALMERRPELRRINAAHHGSSWVSELARRRTDAAGAPA
jgi:spore coat polysaccharide biosynthesis protein SpsF